MASGARPRAARAKGRLSEVSRLSVRAQNRVRVAALVTLAAAPIQRLGLWRCRTAIVRN